MNRGKKHYGYKKNIGIDRKHKVIRKYAIASAEVLRWLGLQELLDENNSNGSAWADSAYLSLARVLDLYDSLMALV